ncbi:MAG: VOC family protein, partial [Candidatus Latescibacteria bacterium]|nr:VOC family protein [Candidatus Latescibacterota bacterium]NIM66217.1 VOC family protein [Candidatus Latescibacterota bacterium]NIO02741.1 VOC family protein [Candidatus Latescibacterota bacterium]NIT03146.1 VOC family protein [Candidatus Latescibacterota bacterium]NIT39634.1 VOC family protein [Candidatus Latescibacterota bacterium]
MGKIKHVAIATQDPDKTAQFYINVFGLREIAKINSPGASGFHLTDGEINLAVLKFKNDQTAGVKNGKD